MMRANRDMEEEEEALLRPGESGATSKQGDAEPIKRRKAQLDSEEAQPFSLGQYSTMALLAIFAITSLIIWTLPAPTLMGKLNLLQQSWHLNTVLDEAAHLHEQINDLHKEKADLEQEIKKEEARAIELKKRLESADSQTVTLRKQLKTDEQTLTGLRDSSKSLEEQINKERDRRKELLHELQSVKAAELPVLKRMVRDAKNMTEVKANGGLVGAGVRLRSTEPGFADLKVSEEKPEREKTKTKA